MDLSRASKEQLLEALKALGVEPTALSLASIEDLSDELQTRGEAFVAGIFIQDEDTMAAGSLGKVGTLHTGEPYLQIRLACHVMANTFDSVLQEPDIDQQVIMDIIEEELGGTFGGGPGHPKFKDGKINFEDDDV